MAEDYHAERPLFGGAIASTFPLRFQDVSNIRQVPDHEGMCTMTISASVPALKPAECVGSICPSATTAQYVVLYFGLYLIALGTGGIKPCVSSFGAGQFDDTDPKERVKKGSFFNWFYFSIDIDIGALVAGSLIVWIQENIGWGLGFGISALFMGTAIANFFLGTPLYRFQKPGGSPLTRVCQVLVASFHKWNLEVPIDSSLLYETPDKTSAIEGSRKLDHTDDLKFDNELNKVVAIKFIDLEESMLLQPMLAWLLGAAVLAAATIAAAAETSSGCPTSCGDINVTYPFGTKEGC